MFERVDEWLMAHLNEFSGKTLQSVAKGELDLGSLEDEKEKESLKQTEDEYKDLVAKMKESLGDKVKEVRVSHRLTSSPSCLVVQEGDMNVALQNMLKQAGHSVPSLQPTLEINPNHPIIQKLKDEKDDARFTDWSSLLLDQAMLSEGGQLEDPASFVTRLNNMFLHFM